MISNQNLCNFILKTLFFSLVFFNIQKTGQAQTVNANVLQVKFYYEKVDFQNAITSGNALLKSPESLSPAELSFLHRYIALSYYNVGQIDSARTHFLSLLSIDPNTELDPVATSPKIIYFFEEIKKDYRELSPAAPNIAYTQYVFVEDLRPSAGLRSMALPGWGQFYKGQKTRGYILGGAFGSSLVAMVVAFIKEDQTHQEYLNSVTPEDIESNYNTYNSWYKTRRTLSAATAALWAIAVGDAFLSPYAQPALVMNFEGGVSLAVNFRL